MSWDAQTTERAKQLWVSGASVAEIAKQLNVSRNAVLGKMWRSRLMAGNGPPKPKPRDEWSRPFWTPDRISDLATLWNAGIGVPFIAGHFETAERAIYAARRRFGLPARR